MVIWALLVGIPLYTVFVLLLARICGFNDNAPKRRVESKLRNAYRWYCDERTRRTLD